MNQMYSIYKNICVGFNCKHETIIAHGITNPQ